MNKRIIKMIKEEVGKIEQKDSFCFDVDWDEPLNNCSINLAYKCLERIEKQQRKYMFGLK